MSDAAEAVRHRRRRRQLLVLAGVLAAAWCVAAVTLGNRPLDRRSLVPRPTRVEININTADADTLTLLPGIGATTANRIVEDRERNGPLRKAEELERVKRIGPAIRRGVEPFVKFGEGDTKERSSSQPPR